MTKDLDKETTVKDRHDTQRDDPPSLDRGDRETDSNGKEATLDELRDMVAAKDDEIQSLNDKILRLAADVENTRKRLQRERNEGIAFANESLIKELLPVVDNLERAIQHAEEETDMESVLEGIKMTYKSFLDVLNRFGCTPFDSVGKDFDPCYHEAVMQQETVEHPPNTVIQEFQRGYMLHDRLLRPAMVVVAKGSRTVGPGEQVGEGDGSSATGCVS